MVIDLTEHDDGTIRFDKIPCSSVDIADLDASDFLFPEPQVDPGVGHVRRTRARASAKM